MTLKAVLTRFRVPVLALGLLTAPLAAQSEGLSGSYLAGRSAEAAGDFEAAARFFREALSWDPDNPALLERAMVYSVQAGDVPAAFPLAERLEKIVQDSRYVPLLFAVEELRAGAFPNAIQRLEANRDRLGDLIHGLLSGWAHAGEDMVAAGLAFDTLNGNGTLKVFGAYHKALAFAVTGDLESAAKAIEAAEPDFLSGDRRALRIRAQILAATGRQVMALKLLDTAVENGLRDAAVFALRDRIRAGEPVSFDLITNPTEGVAEALYTVALVLGSSEDNRDFAILLTRLAQHLRPDLEEARMLAADLLESGGQFDLALSVLATIPETSPEHLRAQTLRAATLSAAGRRDEAIVVLEGLTKAHPEEIGPVLALASALRNAERFADGAKIYDRAIELIGPPQTRHWVVFYERGICLERSGQWDRAEADFRKALELQPDQPLVLNYLGYSLVELGRNYEEAEKMIRRAVEQRPEDGYITDSLAWVLYRLGRYEEAVGPMERAVALVPADPILNDHLGDIFWKVGRKLEARFQWKRALSFEPEEKDLARIRRKLEVGLDRVLEEEAASAAPESVKNGG